MVQGHPRLKVTVPVDSPWLVSYSASIDTVIVFFTVFENSVKTKV